VDHALYRDLANKIEYTDALSETVELSAENIVDDDVIWTRWDSAPVEYHDVTLDEVMQISLQNAEVLRTLGGEVRSTENMPTLLDPAVQATDPRFGVEAALAPFDAVFTSSVNAENNDRNYNNQFAGGGARSIKQDLVNLDTGITKKAASGSEFAIRHLIEHDASNAPGNAFPSAWSEFVELEARHPLLRGNGTLYNRVAGPGAGPGVYNGVLIARNSVDISLMDLEANLRDYLSDVESVYWELAFSYRRLRALTDARDKAYETWQDIRARRRAGSRGSEASREAQARSQYYDLQSQVFAAERGPEGDLTRTTPGVHGGEFRGVGSVRANERSLRQLIGLPISDNRPLRPVDEPVVVPIQFDITSMQSEMLYRRVELRRQQLVIRNREMSLWASRQLLKPRLDLVVEHRFRGFGDDLTGTGGGQFGSANRNLLTGDYQDTSAGLQYEVTWGSRRETAAIEQAQLMLKREQMRMEDRERQFTIELVSAIERVDAAFEIAESQKQARDAAWEELNVVELAYDEGEINEIDQVLVAQRKFAERDTGYYKAIMDYVLAVKNVHYQKGSLLEYNHVVLADAGAATDCYIRPSRVGFRSDQLLDYVLKRPTRSDEGNQANQPTVAALESGAAAPETATTATDSVASSPHEIDDPAESAASPSDRVNPPGATATENKDHVGWPNDHQEVQGKGIERASYDRPFIDKPEPVRGAEWVADEL
jgi:outer membrane protein TolC